MEGFDYVEEPYIDELSFDLERYIDDELSFDPQDNLNYDLEQRDYFGRYLNKYGDMGYIDPGREEDKRLISEWKADRKTDEFYRAQKSRFWYGNRYGNYPGEIPKFYLGKNTEQLFVKVSKKKRVRETLLD